MRQQLHNSDLPIAYCLLPIGIAWAKLGKNLFLFREYSSSWIFAIQSIVNRFTTRLLDMNKNLQIDDLVARIASDDDAIAYKQLFQSYHGRLFQFAYSITHSKETAEEIVSDVFLKIWMKRKSLIKIQNKHLYLYICTKNLAINRLIKDKRNRVFSLDECLVELRSIYFDPEQLMITAEMVRRVQHAINELPPKCRMIFKLVKEDGLKYKEVAELLGLSSKTVENQMTIALRKMDQSIGFDIVRSISS